VTTEGKTLSLQGFDTPPADKRSLLEETRRLVLAYGWNTTSYQILNPGIKRWFSTANDAVVGFVAAFGVRIVAGAPVCARERLAEVAAEFEDAARQNSERVCYLAAEARLETIYKDAPNAAKILLGAQPVWQPKNWTSIVAKHKSLRAQLNRARNKDVRVAEWTREKASRNPVLSACVREWLDAKGLPPLHFLVEPDTLERLYDRRVFVAERDGEVVGFVMLSPVATRNGWLFEQFIHRPKAPNGTVELMIDAAMRELAADGCDYATLGLSPLSTRAAIEPFDNPLWIRVLLAWMRKHAQRFYNFDGLDAFKAKLQPERWEPVFAIYNRPRISVRLLYAIAAAFSGNKPVRLILGGLWRAVLTEIKWLRQSIDKKFGQTSNLTRR
jgi:phosphatidylglycerol lysyltransferase